MAILETKARKEENMRDEEQTYLQHTMPYSEDAERGVLGSMLLDPERVIDLCREKQVHMDTFYIRRHGLIFDTLIRMHHANEAIDLLTLSNRLQEKNLLNDVGGQIYLNELIDSTPTDLHAEFYLRIVLQKYLRRQIIERARDAIMKCHTSDEDAKVLLSDVEKQFFEIANQQRTALEPWSKIVTDVMKEVELIYQGKKRMTGFPSGFVDLDKKMEGMKPGDMIVLAARPSMGKTSLALNIAERVASVTNADPVARAVAVFSLEMTADQLARRMLCSRAKVPSRKLMGGNFINNAHHEDLVNAADSLLQTPIFLDDTPGLEVLDMVSRARRLKQRHDIQFIVIDYLQLMHYREIGNRQGRQLEVAAISGAVKAMAKSLGVPVLVLSQLSRATETRDRHHVPQLSDLRDSGSIEQDADLVLLLRRPCRIRGDEFEHDRTLSILSVAKNRNGPTGEIHLHFSEDYTRFDNRAYQDVDSYDE
jgi:replicative DNA helicase